MRIACLVGMNEREIKVKVMNASEEEVERSGEKRQRERKGRRGEKGGMRKKKRNSNQRASECENMLSKVFLLVYAANGMAVRFPFPGTIISGCHWPSLTHTTYTTLVEKNWWQQRTDRTNRGNASFATKRLTMDPHLATVQLELVFVDRCCCGGYLSHGMASAPFFTFISAPLLFIIACHVCFSLTLPLFPIPQTNTFAQWHVFLHQK